MKHLKQKNLKGFTLVELIIVITILAILGTIGFVSFQGYTSDARDANRTTILGNIEKGLNIFELKTSIYPEPNNITGTGIVDGVTLNYVGTIGQEITNEIGLSSVPLDPSTNKEYIYSTTSNYKKYQIGATMENLQTSIIIPKAYADSYYAKVNGNYKYPLKLGNSIYSLPSLLFVGSGITNLTTFTGFILDKETNIPNSNNNTKTIQDLLEIITGTGNLTLTGIDISTYETSSDFKDSDTTSLEETFGLTKEELGQTIFLGEYSSDINVSNESSGGGASSYGCIGSLVTANATIINNTNLSSDTNYQTIDSGGDCYYTCKTNYSGINCETYIAPLSGWRALDSNCDIDDIPVGSQTWAGCNSTLGAGIIYNASNYCRNYQGSNLGGTSCYGYDTKESDYNSTYGVNNIWGKLYTWTSMNTNCFGGGFSAGSSNSNCPCPSGRHVPSDAEWTTLENTLYGSSCRTADGRQCDGLGWKENTSYNPDRKMVETLKLPLAGYRSTDGSTFVSRGRNTYLWSSAPSSTGAYFRYLSRADSTVYRNVGSQDYGFSVRCIKD